MSAFVQVQTGGAVAAIRLDRPPMNALNTQVVDELAAAAAQASADDTEDQRTGMRSFIENGPGKATFSGR